MWWVLAYRLLPRILLLDDAAVASPLPNQQAFFPAPYKNSTCRYFASMHQSKESKAIYSLVMRTFLPVNGRDFSYVGDKIIPLSQHDY